jgi:hypothetical protein
MSSHESHGSSDEPASSDAAATEAAGENPEPQVKAKAKKRKKKAPVGSEAPAPLERPARDAQGRDRPAFLLRFPEDPELEPLISAFEVGNYAKVREQAPRLVERSESLEVKAAAAELLRRIEPDPLVKMLLAVAIGLFFAVVGFVYYSR